MKITIDGSPKELVELLDVLNSGEIAAEKKAELPPLLTELAAKETAPQAKAVEQGLTFASIKPRFDACIKRIIENSPQSEATE